MSYSMMRKVRGGAAVAVVAAMALSPFYVAVADNHADPAFAKDDQVANVEI